MRLIVVRSRHALGPPAVGSWTPVDLEQKHDGWTDHLSAHVAHAADLARQHHDDRGTSPNEPGRPAALMGVRRLV